MGESVTTFAIPCWQAGANLRPLLESLLAQTRQDFELVLVDDASTDGSAEQAREIAGERIRIHRNPERLGLARNWNRCAGLVTTPLFCLAHMDDVYYPEYHARMAAALEQAPSAGMAHCRAEVLDGEGQAVDSPAERYKDKMWRETVGADRASTYAALYRGNFVNCPSVLYRTEAWAKAGPFDEAMSFALDWRMHFSMLLAGFDAAGVPDPLIGYRRHATNATHEQARSLQRYREEHEVERWARNAGIEAGLLPPDAKPTNAMRNNLLHDAYRDLQRGDREAARAKVRFAADVPELARDPALLTFAALSRLGTPGRAVLGLGLRAVLAGAR